MNMCVLWVCGINMCLPWRAIMRVIPRFVTTLLGCFKNIALVALLALSAPVWAATYHVDPAGNDDNDGKSTAKPWRSLNKVNSTTFAPGDKIVFKAGGIWTGQLHPLGSGASGNPIVINRYGTGAKPIINGPGTNASAGVLLLNQSYWEINNLEVTNSHPTSDSNRLTGILASNTGTAVLNHIYVRDCYVHKVNSAPVNNGNYDKYTGGIIIRGPFYDTLVEGNYISDVRVEGARTFSATGKNIFRDNFIENVYGDGIVINSSNGESLIEYNVVSNACMTNYANFAGAWTYASTGTKIQFNEVGGLQKGYNDGEAFDADIDTNGDIFQYNYSHDNRGGFMLFMPNAKNITVRYNISENDGHGQEIFHYPNNGNTTNRIYNNTFYVGPGISTVFGSGPGVYNFQNNIVKVDGTITKFSYGPIRSDSTFKNNVFFPASITSVNGPDGTVSGNINVDPLFIAAGTGGNGMMVGANGFASAQRGYVLESDSPAIGAGVLLSGNGGFDYWGNPVSTTAAPNIGAYEGPGQSPLKLNSTADAYVRNGAYAGNNYGPATAMWVKADGTDYFRKSYVKFNITAAGSVSMAALKLYAAAVGATASRTISVYAVPTTTWGETNLTWNNAPAGGALLGKFDVRNTAGVWYNVDVTSYVQSQKSAGNNTISLLLVNDGAFGSTNDVQFATKEAATGKPQLIIAP